jgi:cell division protein FtsB
MTRPIDLVIGAIHDMNDDRLSGWSAYFAADTEREKLVDEVKKLKEQIRRLKSGSKKQG